MDAKQVSAKVAAMQEAAQTHILREILANGTHQLALRTKDAKLETECRMQLHNLLDIKLDREQADLLWLENAKKQLE